MQVGLVGSGNMARALARGWGVPVLCTDVVPDRARALAAEVGGEAVGSNAELAGRADLVVLCHKPAQLGAIAEEVAPRARAVASILGGTPLADVKAAYPDRPVYRILPSTPVEVRQGAVVLARDDEQDVETDAAVRELFARLGTLVVLDDALVDTAMGLMSCAPGGVRSAFSDALDAVLLRGRWAA
jgi:pyrroline-5-carboxylate reductase